MCWKLAASGFGSHVVHNKPEATLHHSSPNPCTVTTTEAATRNGCLRTQALNSTLRNQKRSKHRVKALSIAEGILRNFKHVSAAQKHDDVYIDVCMFFIFTCFYLFESPYKKDGNTPHPPDHFFLMESASSQKTQKKMRTSC